MTYNAEDIKVLEGLDPVKLRPGMYTRTDNPNHIIEEVVDNSCDEALAGFANQISITYTKDKKMIIEDNGRGIPTGIHKEKNISAAEVVFTSLHAGGKFEKGQGGAYDFSGGLHGVGVTVTNALSLELVVEIKREGLLHRIQFNDGYTTKPLEVVGKAAKKDTGTKVIVQPDPKYFADPDFDIPAIEKYLKSKALLLAGTSVVWKIEQKDGTFKEKVWIYDSIVQYIEEELQDKTPISKIYYDKKYIEKNEGIDGFNTGEGAEWAVVWVEESGTHKESYVNLITTKLGGTHESGFRNGLFEAIKLYAEHNNLLPKGIKIGAEDIWSKIHFVLSTKILEPEFQGQTKEKLNNRTAIRLISYLVKDKFESWLNHNTEEAKKIVSMMVEQAQLRDKKAPPKVQRKQGGITLLPEKLTDCQSKNPAECELFIVEGDSAGGSAKQGRSKETQAILALRGKPFNTWEAEVHEIMANAEIADISTAMGIEPHGEDDVVDLSKLRYHKICVLSDADDDGRHIQVLLIALFLKHFPKLIENGHIYIAQPPLFKIEVKAGKKGEQKYYALDESELNEIKKKLHKEKITESQYAVSRFKGLGEMNPSQLKETTLHPDKRKLTPVIITGDKQGTVDIMNMLLGKKRSEDRKKWITEDGDFLLSE